MEQENEPAGERRVKDLQQQIDELKKNWPAHSVPAAMLQRLEDLEEALEIQLQKTKVERGAQA